MKKYLAAFNRPLLIKGDNTGEPSDYFTVYGFLAPYTDDYYEHERTIDHIWDYAGYLCVYHEWSNNNINDVNEVIYLNGKWNKEQCSKCMDKLGLIYTLHTIDTDDIDGTSLEDGVVDSLIVNAELMDVLIDSEDSPKNEQTAFLFNRPIFLPKDTLWEGEKGYCLVYGTTTSLSLDRNLFNETNAYLGFLCMCEEVFLNNVTPSGYTASLKGNDMMWYLDGKAYLPNDEEIRNEAKISQRRHNLKIRGVARIDSNLIEGVKDSLILSKDLYEKLLEKEEKVDVQILDF